MSLKTFTLDDLADEIKDAAFVEWFVAPGDTVKEGDDLCEIVTDKASLVLSVPCSGKVAEIFGVKNEKIDGNKILLKLESDD